MILDRPIECPRCGKKTKLVDEVCVNGVVVLRLCSLCSGKPLDALLVEFRRLVSGVAAAVDRHCDECGGRGWRFVNSGRGMMARRCSFCVGTGANLNELLRVLEVVEKPKPTRSDADGLSPGRAYDNGNRRK